MTSTTAQNTPEPSEDGAQLLELVRAALTHYVVLPNPESEIGVVLWIAATHAVPAWAHAARLVIRAPEKRCGKSRLLDLVEAMCHKPLMTANASPSAVYRSIGLLPSDPPTVLLDEADTVFGPRAAGDNEDLRGLLNAGHQRGRPAIRFDAATRRVERIDTFAMAALAGIGAMPDTIEDRALVIKMRRRAPGETVAPYRSRRDGPALDQLRARLHEWVRRHKLQLELATPPMPIEDRAADTWEPLVAIADLAGATWPTMARHAALMLTEAREASETQTTQARLLADCRTAFADADALPTVELLRRLKDDPEGPWATYGHTGLSPVRLGNLLREFDIGPETIRFPTGQAKGYHRETFRDAWERYCPTDSPTIGATRPYQPYQAYPDGVSPSHTEFPPGSATAFEPYQSRTTRNGPVPPVPEPYQPENGRDKAEHLPGTGGTAHTDHPWTPPMSDDHKEEER